MRNQLRFYSLKLVLNAALIINLCLFSLTACSEQTHFREAETYLLPANYIGAFYVIYNQSNGEPLLYKDNVRQYIIPENGVLLSQAIDNEGSITTENLSFYRVDKLLGLNKITARWLTSIDTGSAHTDNTDNTVYIFGGGPGIYSHSNANCNIYFRGFHIGTKSQIVNEINHFDIEDIIEKNNITCN